MVQIKKALEIFLSRIIGFVIFLILLAGVNIISYYITSSLFTRIVFFLNSNLWTIIIFTVVLMIGEIFGALIFPFNIPSPLFNAIGSVFLIGFLFSLMNFLIEVIGINIPFNMDYAYYIIVVIVFIVIIIAGYIRIFYEMIPKKQAKVIKNKIR
jgi:hypothetical protein